jgi:hydrogenase nickel incorporation protein HypB
MCSTCGCGDDAGTRVTTLPERPDEPSADLQVHPHGHPHARGHDHVHPAGPERHDAPGPEQPTRTVVLEREILAKNDALAARNRGWLAGRGVTALNIMSAPGSGKTTLLARTITEMSAMPGARPFAVIEGDQETLLDAERIRATGVPVVQINTGAGCHLDADMLRLGLRSLSPSPESVLFVENVGNLVCPALFDLGETARVVVISVTEGADKPLKYPHMFAAADLVLINKADLLPYVDFDVDACISSARQVKPDIACLVVSAKTGDGMRRWYEWVSASTPGKRALP